MLCWPTPGSPLILNGEAREITLVVEHHEATMEAVREWARGLRLIDRHGEAHGLALLETATGEQATAPPFAAERRTWPELPPVAAPRSRAILRLHSADNSTLPGGPSKQQLWHLAHGDRILRRNCICRMPPGRTVRLAFASDLHIAALWDRVAEAIERHVPHLFPTTLHPSELLRKFVREANELAAAGELDAVVLGGDLVDHVYVHPRREVEQGRRDTNLDALLAMTAPLQVPMFAIPGNHDYRIYPWRPRAYGLGSIGLDKEQTRKVLRAAGWWDWLPLAPSDTDALKTYERDEDLLVHHRQAIAPTTDFHADLRGLRLVFANTGRDVVLNWNRVERERRSLMIRGLRSSWVDPDSEGLHEPQLHSVERAIDGAPAAVLFTHAPLFHPRHRRREHAPFAIDPGERNGLASRVHFENRLFATGHRGGVIFRNPGEMIRTLTRASQPLAMISGHVHKATAIHLDRRQMTAQLAPFAAPVDGDSIPLLTAPSLGHRRGARGEKPGYILATFLDGRLSQVERRFL